jgi:LmbE family N-acetylglucosaminyl deacetylase
MKALFVHAHFDDYEFLAAGTFELWKRKLGKDLQTSILICTDGQAGHHFHTRIETGAIRLAEQQASAKIGNYNFQLLKLPDGRIPRENEPITINTLAGLWKAIRNFEPDYLICPPYVTDPLAGIHTDHQNVAEAVRRVAYMINVPHAFTPEFPTDETQSIPCKVPVILNTYDCYASATVPFDLAVDVEPAFDILCEMSYCHQSQIKEWLPWVGRHAMPAANTLEEWKQIQRQRLLHRNKELGIKSTNIMEVFTVTAWGEIPTIEQLTHDFPIIEKTSSLESLKKRLNRWRGEF